MLTKIKSNIFSKKGETLVESLISILVFSLILVTVVLTVNTALRITALATENAIALQEEMNEIVRARFISPTVPLDITFTYTIEGGGSGTIEITHNVHTVEELGLRAFRPAPAE